MENKHIDRIENEIGNGCSNPYYATLDGSIPVVFKSFNNEQGNLILVNELVCYKIATFLGLPIPEAGIAYIDADTNIEQVNIIPEEGLGFYSNRIDNATQLNNAMGNFLKKCCVNADIFVRILLFDHLIYNADRNPGNLLFNMKEKKLYIIDHTHCFNLESIWDALGLKQCMQRNDYNDTKILDSNEFVYSSFFGIQNISYEQLKKEADYMKTILNKNVFSKIVDTIPKVWDVTDKDKEMLVEYLDYRLGHLDDICKAIVKYREV